MTATATRQQVDSIVARRERAVKALHSGLFRIWRLGAEGNTFRWALENGGGKTYTISYDRQQKSFTCTCPDFQKRGAQVGTCKHIEAVKIWERQRRTNGKVNGINGASKNTNGAAAPATHTGDPLWALVEALREQNEILNEIRKELRQINTAIAQGAGLM